MSRFKPATKLESKIRLAISAPAGAGKTYSALAIATGLGKRIAVIDTEHGSARKYSDRFSFDVLELETFAPAEYISALEDAARERYDVVIVDSLSHAWAGKGGALEQVDRAASKNAGNSFVGWRDVRPQQNALIDALQAAPVHLIVTLRAKMEYVLEDNDRGKKVPRKVGLAPVQGDGIEYVFDVFAEMDLDHSIRVTKSRIPELDGFIGRNPGAELGEQLLAWTRGEKPPLLGKLGDMIDVDLRAASAASLGRYMDAGNHLLEGKHGPKAEALRAHLREVEALFNQRMDEERQAAEGGSYLDNTQKED